MTLYRFIRLFKARATVVAFAFTLGAVCPGNASGSRAIEAGMGAAGIASGSPAPLEVARRVADRVVDNTSFNFEYAVQKPYPDIEFVDFGRSCPAGPGVAYALTTMTSEVAQQVKFEVGRTGPLTIWIDGRVVFSQNDYTGFKVSFDEKTYNLTESFTVDLRAGDHKVMVKSAQDGGKADWLFILQAVNMSRYAEKGQKIKCSLKEYAPKAGDLAHWLVAGTFEGDFAESYEPERSLNLYGLFRSKEGHADGGVFGWNIPRVNLLVNNEDGGKFYNWSYHVGCFSWALQELTIATGDGKYMDYADRWCEYAASTQEMVDYQTKTLNAVRSMNFGQAGRPMLDYVSAPAMPYVTRLSIGSRPDDYDLFRGKAAQVMDYLVKEQFRTAGVFARTYTEVPSVWADDMFMGLPYLVWWARVSQDRKERDMLLDDAARQLIAFNGLLFDKQAGLYSQACYPSRPEVKIPFWSRGNGWALWAATEVLAALPESHPLRGSVYSIFTAHIDGLLRYMDSEGFWKNVLDMEGSVRESSGAAIFTMCLARGINNGWLAKDKYAEPLGRAWSALMTFVDSNGDFHGVKAGTNFSTDPMDYERVGFIKSDTHGLLPLIFACIEMDRFLN